MVPLVLQKLHAPGFYLDASTHLFGFLGSIKPGNYPHCRVFKKRLLWLVRRLVKF